MNISIKKPILVAGVSLSFLLWFWQSLTTQLGNFGDVSFICLMLSASVFYFIRSPQRPSPLITPLDESTFNQNLVTIKKLINLFAQESAVEGAGFSFTEQLNYITNQYENKINQKQLLSINILSNHHFNSLKINEKLSQITEFKLFKFDTYALSSLTPEKLIEINLKSDLVLLVIQGDITQSEKIIIEKLANNYQKILLIFNQIDYQREFEREIILKQLDNNLSRIITKEEIINICSKDQVIKVKKYFDENNYQESEENHQANYINLIAKLQNIKEKEVNSLALNSAHRQSIKLKKEIYQALNKLRKKRALPIIEKYQWIAGSATFANPVSSLDLLAVGAVNAQMIIDLGTIYQQKITLNQARQIATELGKLMLKLGIVEMSTQAIATILKTNTITYVAGGILQGISAAYLTRICSLSLIEYLEKQEIDFDNQIPFKLNIEVIKNNLKWIFEQNKNPIFLTNFIKKNTFNNEQLINDN
ncbi:MAG: DUF697 domain-containing protein [Cyanobacterium sp. T60_A2020_053]|nr:DUF697 domain-containing protein [Cyanobacterium sp. T60_A2020_053]